MAAVDDAPSYDWETFKKDEEEIVAWGKPGMPLQKGVDEDETEGSDGPDYRAFQDLLPMGNDGHGNTPDTRKFMNCTMWFV